ncbi:hypothetical protein Moror_2775 [Moniliophthora roreri MCA 2997]|uniref:Uncharacterized protein n=1 Tax=Moniliophthora roreri (strain MCA 2997) TaxID=1381753 RepID=V2WWW3_MONRO|nr:hypothetical protein Moror_2775 [Moniliophthora roreri MCA 2997]
MIVVRAGIISFYDKCLIKFITFSVQDGNNPSGTPLKQFPQADGTSLTWTVDLSSGTSISLLLRDNAGATAQSAPVTIQAGTSTDCHHPLLYKILLEIIRDVCNPDWYLNARVPNSDDNTYKLATVPKEDAWQEHIYIPVGREELYKQRILTTNKSIMGAIFSSIGRGINAIISAIANVIMTIVSAITTVIVTIFDVILDILCCRCFGSRRSGMRTGRRRRGAATY